MPPKVDRPPGVRAFEFHGVAVQLRDSDEGIAECPFCAKRKLYVNLENTKWECKACGRGGNDITFLRELHETSLEDTPRSAYESLGEHRGILPETLKTWGLCRSKTTGEWVVPGYSHGGKLTQLYRYLKAGEKHVLMATPNGPPNSDEKTILGLIGIPLSQDRKRVYVCEGPWDGMRLWEVLRSTKVNEDGTLSPTANPEASLLSTFDVVAVPGAGAWKDGWCKFVADKDVALLYDNDAAGANGIKHACRVMGEQTEYVTTSVSYLDWSQKEGLPTGYDVRDHLVEGREKLPELQKWITPVKAEWTPSRTRGKVEILPEKCESWKELKDAWRRAIYWTPGMEGGLACMLASIASVKSQGEQLWLKVIGPPSSGKTILCEAVSIARRYVYPKSDLRGFFSAYKEDKAGTHDFSLAHRLYDKTLITKDGDPILQSPYREQILAHARDIYDTAARPDFKNGVIRDYENLRMTWILCGTAALRALDRSELGQRFCDWVMMDGIDDDLEYNMALRGVFNQFAASRIEANCKAETQHSPEYLKAMKLTGGYIEYLRRNWKDLSEKVSTPDSVAHSIVNHARFVSYLRARPSDEENETATREVCTRLSKQLGKWALFLALVQQKESIADPMVFDKVKKIALDTARGRTMEIVRALDTHGPMGGETIARHTGQKWKTEEGFVLFLQCIGAIEQFDPGAGRYKWRMTPRFNQVWKEVMGG